MRGPMPARVASSRSSVSLGHGLAGDLRAADLEHGVEQEAARLLGVAGVMEAERPRVEAVPQVARHAGHRSQRERFDAELLEHVEDQPLHRLGRCQARVQRGIGAREAQRETIGGAAERGVVVAFEGRMQVCREQWQRPPAAVHAAGAEVQVSDARQGAHGSGAELFDLLPVADLVPVPAFIGYRVELPCGLTGQAAFALSLSKCLAPAQTGL